MAKVLDMALITTTLSGCFAHHVSALFNEKYPDDTSLCRYLLDEARVALTPGSAFGDPHCVRFSYSVADEVLEAALSRVKKALYA